MLVRLLFLLRYTRGIEPWFNLDVLELFAGAGNYTQACKDLGLARALYVAL